MATVAPESSEDLREVTGARDFEPHQATEWGRQTLDEPTPLDNGVADVAETEKSTRSSFSHWDPEPGFAHVDGDIGGSGLNETKVDIIAVPCIGAPPVETWVRDPLPTNGYFGGPSRADIERDPSTFAKPVLESSVLSPAIDRHLPKAQHLWIRHGIKKEVNTARVLLYRHRKLYEGLTLDEMADDLLKHICQMREGTPASRPFFFICHSIGGLVAKLALVKASKMGNMRWIIFDCHGMTFFATPHRGSSYMSMPNLRESMQHLLDLPQPLPRSITDGLRLNHRSLLDMHDVFTDIASEMHIWTFYETIDSQLSGFGAGDLDEVHFSAPIASIKSSIVGSRHEQALSLESDHARCPSFGINNISTMHSYLIDLGRAVRKAQELSSKWVHTPLKLADNVKLELIGFYDDPDPDSESDVRLYSSKHYLNEFLDKGPENCLRERLNTVAAKPRRLTLRPSQLPSSSSSGFHLSSGALGIWSTMQDMGQKLFNGPPSRSQVRSPDRAGRPGSPQIVVTSDGLSRPPPVGASNSMPASVPSRSRGLTVPSLSTPGFNRPSRSSSLSKRTDSNETARTLSDPTATDVSPRTVGPVPIDQSVTHDAAPGLDENDYDPGSKVRGHHVSQASALEDLTAGFSRPDPNKRKFMWIHLPFNNPHWVKSIFDKLSETQHQSYSKLLQNDYWVNRQVQGRHAQAHASYVKPGCGFVASESHSPRPSSPSFSGRSSPTPSPTHLYLHLPYLHFDTYINIVRRRNIIKRRLRHGRARPVPKNVAEKESLELRVIWEYVGHDPPFNTRRTLDQYGYPSLQDTYARDDDQILYKLTKEQVTMPFSDKRDIFGTRAEKQDANSATSPASRLESVANKLVNADVLSRLDSDSDSDSDLEDDILDGNVLMVDQLWLWAVDTTTLTTFFPKRESHPTEGPMFQQADLRNSVYNELNGDLTGRCENALDLAAFITLHAVTVLLDRTSHPDLEIFRIFEEAIGVLIERMTSSLKRFRMQTFRDKMQDSDSSDMEENRSSSIKKRHKRELEQAERENREHTSAVLELRDMDDELNTMKKLFDQQTTAIEDMRALYDKPELQEHTHNGQKFLDEALIRLDEYRKQTTDMLERIDTTRKDYEKLLEMVQRQAQVDEVRWSRLQTELASTQNLSVMIFTTFTVIFLPLSFFTSLFGMNTKEWGGDDGNKNVTLGTIGAISLPSSAFLIAASLVAAFSSRVQAAFRAIFKYSRSGVEKTKGRLARMRTKKAKEAKEKRRKMREDMAARRRRKKERGYDFWEQVREERRSEYQIPELNRKTAIRQRLE
ncbi:uncharacterized protein BCR38DRAFT_480569 [Pseudomassariella vexata]|uniref:DUF676 domain-containing protein n=1 Tax=Pseudomassariella vexata TaxID=1141098 RepID=A0A1Y2EKN2_9PEZI|nr:uncharacterized protein BCR38DRAFT_480569 [Pseudomassariella vexata]ORY72099.1 hypothetical protein BCR38DRAFT_480569 [Pseudomassariella vexata]